jgi:hypothetical protein
MRLTSSLFIKVLLLTSFCIGIRLGSSGALRFPFLLLLIAYIFFYLIKGKFKVTSNYVIGGLLFALVAALHIIIIQSPISKPLLLIDFVKYVLLVFLYITIACNIDFKSFNEDAYSVLRILAIGSLFLWSITMITNIKIGVDDSYSPYRLSGFASEPANMSYFLPSLLIYAYFKRNLTDVLIFLTAIFLTFSPTNYIALVSTWALIGFYRRNYFKRILFIAFPLFALFVFMTIIRNGLISHNSESTFILSLLRIYEGLNFIFSLGDSGANNRAELFFAGAEILNDYNLWFTGAGFGSSNQIAEVLNGGLLFDSNSWSSLVLWFGIFSLIPYLYYQHKALAIPTRNFGYVLLSNLVVSNFITGGGVWYQIFLFLLVLIKYRDDKIRVVQP